jgi:hypothetical protein
VAAGPTIGFESIDALLDGVGHRRLRRLGSEAIDDGLQSLDLLGLQNGLLRQALFVLGSSLAVLRVRAAVLDQVAGRILVRTVEMKHASDRLVEEIEVVADHE